MRKKTPKIKMICSKCGKEPKINKEMSNENWQVVDNKPCIHCGGKLRMVMEREESERGE